MTKLLESTPTHSCSHYDLLRVRPTTSPAEIRRAYRKLALGQHPDRNPGNKALEQTWLLITNAYLVLSDEAKRAEYDLTLPLYETQVESEAEFDPASINPSFLKRKPTLGDRIEAAIKKGPTPRAAQDAAAREPKRPRAKLIPKPRGSATFLYRDFSDWIRRKLDKEFTDKVKHSCWRRRSMTPRDFFDFYLTGHPFVIRPEVLEDLKEECLVSPHLQSWTVFVDALHPGAPVIMGKHRAMVALELKIPSLYVFVRVF